MSPNAFVRAIHATIISPGGALMSNHPSYARRRLLAGSVALCALPFGRVFASEACAGSVTNIIGPSYRKGAPFRS